MANRGKAQASSALNSEKPELTWAEGRSLGSSVWARATGPRAIHHCLRLVFKGFLSLFKAFLLRGSYPFCLRPGLKGFLSFLTACFKGFLSCVKPFLRESYPVLKGLFKGFPFFFRMFVKGIPGLFKGFLPCLRPCLSGFYHALRLV